MLKRQGGTRVQRRYQKAEKGVIRTSDFRTARVSGGREIGTQEEDRADGRPPLQKYGCLYTHRESAQMGRCGKKEKEKKKAIYSNSTQERPERAMCCEMTWTISR